MNFDHMPELHWAGGYPAALAGHGRHQRTSCAWFSNAAAGSETQQFSGFSRVHRQDPVKTRQRRVKTCSGTKNHAYSENVSTRTHGFKVGTNAPDAEEHSAVSATISAYWTPISMAHARNSIRNRIARFLPHTTVHPPSRDSAPILPSVAIVPLAEINAAAKRAVDTAFATHADKVIAVHVCDPRRPSATRKFEQQWDDWNPGVNMVFLDGREYSIATPILEYAQRTYIHTRIFVVITHEHHIDPPDNGITHCHANQLENAFRHQPNTVICRTLGNSRL